ncbi:MAG TPA: hypothetical protein ENK68_02345 [Epsilonproteobacteria bacterium]|nr:hypothetical protein [Campylobacterota bacterium]
MAVLYLDMLWTSGEEERFIDASRTLIAKQDMYGAYLPGIIRHIDPQSTPELYVAVWKLYTQRTHSMEDYERLRPYLTQAERLRFIETLAMHKPFYLDLLNAEGEYTTLAKFARDEIRYGFHLPEALAYLAPHDPKEAWAIAVEYCEKLMGDRDRKRKTYQEMMRIFSALEASPAIRDDLRRYLTTLYHHQPKLPALRNEIKKRFGKMN